MAGGWYYAPATGKAGLIFFFLSLKLVLESNLGRQHCTDFSVFSPCGFTTAFGEDLSLLLQTEFTPETKGVVVVVVVVVPSVDFGGI